MSVYAHEKFKLDDQSREILKEMREDPAQKMSYLETLRSWIISHNYLQCRTDDKFLLRFLRVSKFSCEAAKERITKWCVARSHRHDGLPEWFTNQSINDPKLREIIECGMIYLSPNLDDLGRLILIFDVERLKHIKAAPPDLSRAMYLVCEWIIFNFDRAQVNGIVMIEAAATLDMEIMAYWTPDIMRKAVGFWQGAFPMRMKHIDYYNMPAVLRAFVDLAIGFMKPKMQKRLKFHSDHKPPEHVPKNCMPPVLGGEGPEFHEIKGDLIRALEDFQAEFDSFKDCKVDEAKMPKHYEEGDSWGISGTYRPMPTGQ